MCTWSQNFMNAICYRPSISRVGYPIWMPPILSGEIKNYSVTKKKNNNLFERMDISDLQWYNDKIIERRKISSLSKYLSLRSWNLINTYCFTYALTVILDRLWMKSKRIIEICVEYLFCILSHSFIYKIESFVYHIHPVLPVSQIFVINNAETSNALCSWRIPDRLQKLKQVFSGGVCLQTST